MRELLRRIFGIKRAPTLEEAKREATMRAGSGRVIYGSIPRNSKLPWWQKDQGGHPWWNSSKTQ